MHLQYWYTTIYFPSLGDILLLCYCLLINAKYCLISQILFYLIEFFHEDCLSVAVQCTVGSRHVYKNNMWEPYTPCTEQDQERFVQLILREFKIPHFNTDLFKNPGNTISELQFLKYTVKFPRVSDALLSKSVSGWDCVITAGGQQLFCKMFH